MDETLISLQALDLLAKLIHLPWESSAVGVLHLLFSVPLFALAVYLQRKGKSRLTVAAAMLVENLANFILRLFVAIKLVLMLEPARLAVWNLLLPVGFGAGWAWLLVQELPEESEKPLEASGATASSQAETDEV